MNTIGQYGVNAYNSYTSNYQSQKIPNQNQNISELPKKTTTDIPKETIPSTNKTVNRTPPLLPSATSYTHKASKVPTADSMTGQHIDIKL